VRQRALLKVYRPLLERTLNRAARIVATSPAYIASSPLLHAQRDRCVVVPLGIDIDQFAQANAASVAALRARYGAPLLLFVGRLRYYKGLHFLLEAMPLLRADARLLVVGSGPEEERLRAQVQAAGLADRVHFAGALSDEDLTICYGAADVFVLPSHLRSEAFGIVQIEAQIAGLPIVTTELNTGTSHITLHGVTGFVVPPAQPSALARALDVLLANPALARHMGAAGRERARREFGRERMLERIEQVYADL
jgi:rhamnosyl/mannosyltransferase